MPTRPNHHLSVRTTAQIVRLAVLTLILACIGCAGTGGGDGAVPSNRSAALPQATGGTIELDIDSLEIVLEKAIELMHWGRLRSVNEVTAMHAEALTTDDRLVDIRAQQSSDGTVNVQVKVGLFGDAALEQRFLTVLQEQSQRWKTRPWRH